MLLALDRAGSPAVLMEGTAPGRARLRGIPSGIPTQHQTQGNAVRRPKSGASGELLGQRDENLHEGDRPVAGGNRTGQRRPKSAAAERCQRTQSLVTA